MPLHQTIQTPPDLRVHIWKITEPESWLARGIELSPYCQARMDGMKSELHRRGFLSIRHLLAVAGYRDADLFYDGNGKPHLRDGTHISITHSFEYTGIVLSREREVGIDIEKERGKILKIAHRFTPVGDYEGLAPEAALVRKLTRVWGVKESLYKVMSIPGLSFLNHIHVADFGPEATGTSASVLHQGNRVGFRAFFLDLEGFSCAYAYKDDEGNP